MDSDVLQQEWAALEADVKHLVRRVETLQQRCGELDEENVSLEAQLRSCQEALKEVQARGEVRSVVGAWLGETPPGAQRSAYVAVLDRHIACLERCMGFLKK